MNLALRLQHDAALAAQAADAPTPAQPPATPEERYPLTAPNPQIQVPRGTLGDPQSTIACSATTQDGTPCRARVAPGEPFCAFHHPDHAQTIAAGRREGGVARHGRARRLPAVLDHMHVAEFMSELLVEAMNAPDRADLRRLAALTSLSRVLLRAVGTPRRGFLYHADRAETPAHLPHHTRLYPAPDLDREARLAADAQQASEPVAAAPAPPAAPRSPVAVPPEALLLAPDSTLCPPAPEPTGEPPIPQTEFIRILDWPHLYTAWTLGQNRVPWHEFERAYHTPPALGPAPDLPGTAAPPQAELQRAFNQRWWRSAEQTREEADQQAAQQVNQQVDQQVEEQVEEQATNRQSTGLPARENNREETAPSAAALTAVTTAPPVRTHTREESLPECGLEPAALPGPSPASPGSLDPGETDPADATRAKAVNQARPRGPRATVSIGPPTSIHATWPPKLPKFPW
jgi:hypothetical protein